MMRGTLHLATIVDHLNFRSTLQSVLDPALAAVLKGRAEDLDIPKLLSAAEPSLREAPRHEVRFES